MEDYFVCEDEPSSCTFIADLSGNEAQAERVGCNSLKIEFKLTPASPFLHAASLENLVSIYHHNITITNVEFSKGRFTILASNTGDITDGHFHLVLDPSLFDFLANTSQNTFKVNYPSLLAPVHYSEEECSVLESVEAYMTAVEVLSYAMLLFSLPSCKIVGLEMFGLLQLLYIDLATQTFLTLYSFPLTKFGLFNGLSISLS